MCNLYYNVYLERRSELSLTQLMRKYIAFFVFKKEGSDAKRKLVKCSKKKTPKNSINSLYKKTTLER